MKLKTLRLVALAALALAAPLAAQTKIGVVDFQQALLATADMQKQAGDLEAKFKSRQEELDRLAAELQPVDSKNVAIGKNINQQIQDEDE